MAKGDPILRARPKLKRKRRNPKVKPAIEVVRPKLATFLREEALRLGPVVSQMAASHLLRVDGIPEEEAEEIAESVANDVDLTTWVTVAGILRPDMESVAREQADMAVAQLKGGEAEMAAARQTAEKAASDRAAQMVGFKWTDTGELVPDPDSERNLVNTTRKGIAVQVRNALEDGMTRDEMSAAIAGSAAFSDFRAGAIAESELITIDSSAAALGWVAASAVARKVWILNPAHPVTDICDINAAAGAIPVTEPFPTGVMGPLAHPGCICSMAVEAG